MGWIDTIIISVVIGWIAYLFYKHMNKPKDMRYENILALRRKEIISDARETKTDIKQLLVAGWNGKTTLIKGIIGEYPVSRVGYAVKKLIKQKSSKKEEIVIQEFAKQFRIFLTKSGLINYSIYVIPITHIETTIEGTLYVNGIGFNTDAGFKFLVWKDKIPQDELIDTKIVETKILKNHILDQLNDTVNVAKLTKSINPIKNLKEDDNLETATPETNAKQ